MAGKKPHNPYHDFYHDEHGDWCWPNCPFDYASQVFRLTVQLKRLRAENKRLRAAMAKGA